MKLQIFIYSIICIVATSCHYDPNLAIDARDNDAVLIQLFGYNDGIVEYTIVYNDGTYQYRRFTDNLSTRNTLPMIFFEALKEDIKSGKKYLSKKIMVKNESGSMQKIEGYAIAKTDHGYVYNYYFYDSFTKHPKGITLLLSFLFTNKSE